MNVIILVLLAIAFLIIIQRNLLNLSDFLHKENPGMFSSVICQHVYRLQERSRFYVKYENLCIFVDAGMILPFESELSPTLKKEPVRKGDEIPVLITAAEERLGATVAAMNSIYFNSKANVVFTIVTLNDTVEHLKYAFFPPRRTIL